MFLIILHESAPFTAGAPNGVVYLGGEVGGVRPVTCIFVRRLRLFALLLFAVVPNSFLMNDFGKF